MARRVEISANPEVSGGLTLTDLRRLVQLCEDAPGHSVPYVRTTREGATRHGARVLALCLEIPSRKRPDPPESAELPEGDL